MINQTARAKAGFLIRGFLSSEIDNRALIEGFPYDKNDRALNAIERRLWFHYSDVGRHHCEFPLDSPEETLFQRCALFLDTASEYEWPDLRSHNLAHPIIAILSGDTFRFPTIQKRKRTGDYSVWPFFREADMTASKAICHQDGVKADDASLTIEMTGVGVAYVALQTFLFLGGFSASVIGFFIRSETLLFAGFAAIGLYLLLLALQSVLRPYGSRSSVRST